MKRVFAIGLCVLFVLCMTVSLTEAQTTVTYTSTALPTLTPTTNVAIAASGGNMLITKAVGAPSGFQMANFLDAGTLGTSPFTATISFVSASPTAGGLGLTCSNAVEGDTSGRQIRVAFGTGTPPAGDQYLNNGGSGVAMGPYGTGTTADGIRIGIPTGPFKIQLERTATAFTGRMDADNNGTFEITLGTATLTPAARPLGLVIAGPDTYTVSSIAVTYTPSTPAPVPQATPSAFAPTMSWWGLVMLTMALVAVAAMSVRQWRTRHAE